MSANAETLNNAGSHAESGRHPSGLYVLFGTEMWERFSFYSMLALFTLYLRDPDAGFGWTAAEATSLYANYLMFVYLSPLIGGLIADRITGYRKAVMIGGIFFIIGHGLLSFSSIYAVYAALTFLVIGNGFFKPNVSTMVGNLYPEGSHLKDRAYNIFYMGINLGAFIAPIVMEIVRSKFGFHAAFAVAAFGMLISVGILWYFKEYIKHADNRHANALVVGDHVIEDVSQGKDAPKKSILPIDLVPNGRRIGALIVIFIIVIVFWMVFHQNGSTLTYWADDNTDWNVSGTISNSINAFWILVLTFPLVWFWGILDKRGKEPSTPTKMAIGMTLTGLSFLVLWYGASLGESAEKTAAQLSTGAFRVNERVVKNLAEKGVSKDVLDKIIAAKDAEGKPVVYGVKFASMSDAAIKERSDEHVKDGKPALTAEEMTRLKSGEQQLVHEINKVAPGEGDANKVAILQNAYLFKVSPFWLIFSYFVVTLGELMLSPMGLSLVSKVAPIKMRGLLMGGWFVATALGNKLTMIGVYWDIWLQSQFFLTLGLMALFMAVVLFLLLKPLKKAMPGV